ncbi:MAG: LuxR C-terminal-related transcriptional regulator [Synechococcus lacustris]
MEIRLDAEFRQRAIELAQLSLPFRFLICTNNRAYALALATHFAIDSLVDSERLVGICTTQAEALNHVSEFGSDLLVMVSELLDDGSGVELIGKLRQCQDPPLTLLNLKSTRRQSIREAIDSGADAILTYAGMGPALLNQALGAIQQKQRFIDPICLHLLETEKSELTVELTAREVEILRLVTQGMTNREISARLFIAETTARGHVQSIIQKLQVRDRTSAAAEGLRQGYVQ